MIDFNVLGHEYIGDLMRLQRRLFEDNEELDVLKYETIPAMQYCNEITFRSIIKYYNRFILLIDDEATYLNVGSGTNLLEYVAKQHSVDIECADIKETNLIFDPIRKRLNCPLDYTAGLYGDELVVNTNKRYDYVSFIRYVPFELDFNKDQFIKFILSIEKYADNVLISTQKKSYVELTEFFKQNSDIIEMKDVQQSFVFTFKLKDFKKRYAITKAPIQ